MNPVGTGFPPPSLGQRLLALSGDYGNFVSADRGVSHSVVIGWASYGRGYLGAFVPAAQHDFGTGDPVIGGGSTLK